MAQITYTNKVALNENPNIADINKVKADDMNEIKSVVNGLLTDTYSVDTTVGYNAAYINNQVKLLWTNQSPNSSFASQDIQLSSNDYDVLEFIYKPFGTDNNLLSSKTIKGKGANLQTLYKDGTKMDIVFRTATYVNDTTYTISTGNIVQAPGTANIFTTNSQCIPLYVIGYKTNIFS